MYKHDSDKNKEFLSAWKFLYLVSYKTWKESNKMKLYKFYNKKISLIDFLIISTYISYIKRCDDDD